MVIMAIQAVSNLITDWGDEDRPEAVNEFEAEIEELKRAQGITDTNTSMGEVVSNNPSVER